MTNIKNDHPDINTTKQHLAKFLRSHPSLGAELIAQLLTMFRFQKMDKGTQLVRSGSLWQQAFYITEGLMRFYYTTEQGKEFNKGFYCEDDFVWPKAPIARTEPSLFTIECLTPCAFWQIPFSSFQAKLAEEKVWDSFALPYLEHFADEKFIREYEFLIHDAQTKYTSLQDSLGDLIERIPDYHLASYLGITNVALSRVKKRASR
ncbi:MAG: hypothetical protein CENE_01278 [Candidatus Celerinatantimonas neptuna]|nr:MAG: hypothetical protein CENE_01278 [Candidatus Celerinatantimonas neptuna]